MHAGCVRRIAKFTCIDCDEALLARALLKIVTPLGHLGIPVIKKKFKFFNNWDA